MKGWIKLHRRLLDNPLAMQDPDYFMIWVTLLLLANHEQRVSTFKGQKFIVKKGQLITSRKSLEQRVNNQIGQSKIERILKKLEIEQQIEQQGSNHNRLITILKWENYQSNEQQNGRQTNSQRTTKGKKIEHSQEVNTERRKKDYLLGQQQRLKNIAKLDAIRKKVFENKT